MGKKNKQKPVVITFVSGKGGSGKTTGALAISKVLADVEFKVLLVDFDLATSEASYFFLPKLSGAKRRGLVEIINSPPLAFKSQDKNLFSEHIINVGPNFDFIPSRVDFGKLFVGGPEISEKETLITRILEPLIGECGEQYDYILIDNQAGYTNTSAAGVRVADRAVVVSEADRISSDAVDNLVALIGSDMPKFRRYLINKVEIREAGDYRAKVAAFKTMNRLPPLPFDFSVRNAFGDREIPVDLNKPTSFLIAMFATVKEIHPENRERFEEYENERVAELFDQYQEDLDRLLAQRAELQEKLIEFETLEKRRETNTRLFIYRLATLSSVLITIIAAALFMAQLAKVSEVMTNLLYTMAATFAVSGGIVVVRLILKRLKDLTQSAEQEEASSRDSIRFQRKLADLEPQVARYRNLIATRSRELLIDFDKYSEEEERKESNIQ